MLGSIALWILTKIGETAFGKVVTDVLEKWFPDLFKSKTKELVEVYERRIEEKNSEIRRLEQERAQQYQEHQTDQGRLLGSLKRRSIATEKLIEQYHKPLNAILISYSSQYVDDGGRTRKLSFIKDELARFNSKYLGGSDTLVPPASVPGHLRTQEDLREWFEKEILKGRYCKVKFLILFDLRRNAYWGTHLPYIQKRPLHHTIGEVLRIDDVFSSEQIDRLAISEIISSGDIAWLASAVVSEEELSIILKNQKGIESALGNPSLRVLSNKSAKKDLTTVLSSYIENAEEVADAIIDEAQFWREKIKG